MRKGFLGVMVISATLTGCATYETTLTDAKGQTMTCKASGKNGLVSGYFLRKGFEDCVDKARAAGYSDDLHDAGASTASR
jgi:hypothetical protein